MSYTWPTWRSVKDMRRRRLTKAESTQWPLSSEMTCKKAAASPFARVRNSRDIAEILTKKGEIHEVSCKIPAKQREKLSLRELRAQHVVKRSYTVRRPKHWTRADLESPTDPTESVLTTPKINDRCNPVPLTYVWGKSDSVRMKNIGKCAEVGQLTRSSGPLFDPGPPPRAKRVKWPFYATRPATSALTRCGSIRCYDKKFCLKNVH